MSEREPLGSSAASGVEHGAGFRQDDGAALEELLT